MSINKPKPIATPLTIREKKKYFEKKNPALNKFIEVFGLDIKKK